MQVVPAATPAAEVLKHKPAGVFLSNGPGDPVPLDYAVGAVRDLIKTGVPILAFAWAPDSRNGVRWKDVQTQIRPPRRE